MRAATNPPKISIITTCYTMDRFKDITELLDSIQEQSYRNIETIVVAERSPELTENIRNYAQKKDYPNVVVLYNQGEWGLSSARNLGIKQASGEITAFVDDDALLFPNWAEETARAYAQDSSIVGLTGPILPLWEDESMAWFPREFYWIFSCTYWEWTEPTEVRNGYGTNISFRREGFEKCGGFVTGRGLVNASRDTSWRMLAGEDLELSVRIRKKTGKRIVYYPEVKVKHKVYPYRYTLRFISKRAYREGYTKSITKRLYNQANGDADILATEYALLHHIFSKLLPDILKGFLTNPRLSWRRLRITVTILSCVALGYFWGTFHPGRENMR